MLGRWGLDLAAVLERVQGIAHHGRQLEVPVFAAPAGDVAQQRHKVRVNACPLCVLVYKSGVPVCSSLVLVDVRLLRLCLTKTFISVSMINKN